MTDLARATHSVAGVVRGVQHEESIPPPKPMPLTAAVPLPVVQDMVVEEPVAVAALPAVEVPCFEVPFAEPVALPPPRFFPVPTRPVFSGSNCEPWRVAF